MGLNQVSIDEEEMINVQWFNHPSLVFTCLRHMLNDGWIASIAHKGIVSEGLVARPVRYGDENKYTGVALFKLNQEKQNGRQENRQKRS